MKKKSLAALVLLALLVSFVAPPFAQAANTAGTLTVPVTGTANGLPFTGTFTVERFAAVNNQVAAVGTLVGTTTDATTGAITTYVRQISMPVSFPTASGAAAAQASCQILTLTLGPLHLDLLGLVIDLNQVNLNITAEPGPGNLLGNLLCSLAGLLDQGGLSGALQQIVNLLNQILSQL